MDDLISEFISEASASLAALDRDLTQRPDAPETIAALHRFTHTTKSTAGFLQLPRLEMIAEASGLLLANIQQGAIHAGIEGAALLHETLARIRTLIDHLANHGSEPKGEDNDLIERFTTFAVKQRTIPKPIAATEQKFGTSIPTVSKSPVAEAAPTPPKKSEQPLGHDTLDHWMQMVGELVETRNQLQHAMGNQADRRVQQSLQQLSTITTDLRQSVTKARADARVNSPHLPIATVLVMEAGNRLFALPQNHVADLAPFSTLAGTLQNNTLTVRGRALPVRRLSGIMELTAPAPITTEEQGYVVIVRGESSDVALLVDDVMETAEIVIRPMSRALSALDIYSGISLLGDESIALVLAAEGIVTAFGTRKAEAKHSAPPAHAEAATIQFLLFRIAGERAPKAVRLNDMLRLATIDAATVKHNIAKQDGADLALRTLPGTSIPRSGSFDVIVCESASTSIGIVIDEVLDLADAAFAPAATHSSAYMGSCLIVGNITEVIDVAYLLANEEATA